MFKLLRRIVLNESAASFSIWSFSPPWGNYSSKLSCIKKKKKSINRGWLAIFLDPQKTVSQTYRDELSKDREGEINRPGFSQDACLFPDPTPATPHPLKKRELPARSHIKEYFLRSHRDAEWSCWVISAANKWCQAWHFLAGRNRTPLR